MTNRDDRAIAELIHATAQRIGRKAVLVASASGMQTALRIAGAHKDRVSDIILLNVSQHADTPAGVRAHFIASGWSLFPVITALPQLLRKIRIELLDVSSPPPN
jgi:pimeloyl-ACP methyl ester carboxylesterase